MVLMVSTKRAVAASFLRGPLVLLVEVVDAVSVAALAPLSSCHVLSTKLSSMLSLADKHPAQFADLSLRHHIASSWAPGGRE